MTEPKNEITVRPEPTESLPDSAKLDLGATQIIDLTGLSEEQAAELRRQHAAGMIDIQRKAQELRVDVGALQASLDAFNDQTSKATQSGHSATITHTQTTSAGRTEVVIGNTDRAASGKISRSAAGQKDVTIWIIIAVAVVAVIVGLAAFN